MLIDPWREDDRHRWKPEQLVWIEAALTFDWRNRYEAYRDIAAMIGVDRCVVRAKAKKMAAAKRAESGHILGFDLIPPAPEGRRVMVVQGRVAAE